MLKKFNNLFTFVQSVVRSNSDAVAVEEQSAPLVGLQSRLSRHLKTCSAAALLTAGSLMDADAAVVHWNNANLVIPANIDGLYINVETQATGSAGSVVAGWDINPYSATSLTWFNATGTGMCRYPGVTTGSAGNLAPGTLVNTFGSFGSGAVVVGSSPGNWQLNADNYFGFRFVASDGLTHYGWGRMTVGAAITVRTIAEIAYESVAGVEIAVGGLSVPACTAPTLSGLVTNAGCSGATNGGVNLTATGGSPSPLSYLWSNGATTEDLNNVGPGTYSVTVTAGTCSTTSTFTVGVASQPAQPSLACYESASFNNTTCQWDVTGSQPSQPSLACYESATFNSNTCQWDVTGTPSPAIVTTASACDSYTWSSDGNTYTQSGTYSYSANCQDYTLSLIITPTVVTNTVDTACQSYTWSANGVTYTQSGTYSYVADPNNSPCSVAVLNLVINQPSPASILHSATNFNSGQSFVTGDINGQNGWSTYDPTFTTGGGSFATITTSAPSGLSGDQAVRFLSGTGATSSPRYAWGPNYGSAFSAASAVGANTVVAQTKLYVPSGSTSTARQGMVTFDVTGAKILTDFYVQQNTGTVYLLANYNNAGTINNFAFNTNIAIVKDTWVEFTTTWNQATGRMEVSWAGNGFYVDGAGAGSVADETDFYNTRNASTVASTVYFDELSIQFVNPNGVSTDTTTASA